MSHSNSSLNCFASCMAKYKYHYIDHIEPSRPVSPHLTFGTMAHKVLQDAGVLRDTCLDGIQDNDYCPCIPSEVLYTGLKNTFGINNWHNYFTPVIREVAKIEAKLVADLAQRGDVTMERELKLSLPTEYLHNHRAHITQPLVGVIDLLIRTETEAIIIDYKFSSTRKGQDEFDLNSQLPLYAFLVNKTYGIPVRNIQYGYIDIPKQSSEFPAILSNGTLSRAKGQNVIQENYEKAVIAVHGDDPYYNTQPGGHYHDVWCNMALNKIAYLSLMYLDEVTYTNIMNDLLDAAEMVDQMVNLRLTFLKKYDAYTCKSCEYLDTCKPWLKVGGDL